jgi:ketosteroid isomerase-like protein
LAASCTRFRQSGPEEGWWVARIEAEQILNRFVAAWERRDPEELLAYFADDAVRHPMPMKAAVGKAALRKAISEWAILIRARAG